MLWKQYVVLFENIITLSNTDVCNHVVRTQVLEGIRKRKKKYPWAHQGFTAKQILQFLTETKLFHNKQTIVGEEDVEAYLNVKVYDNLLMKTKGKGDVKYYFKPKKKGRKKPIQHLMSTPCGHCTVRSMCTSGGVISPEECVYLKEWLDF